MEGEFYTDGPKPTDAELKAISERMGANQDEILDAIEARKGIRYAGYVAEAAENIAVVRFLLARQPPEDQETFASYVNYAVSCIAGAAAAKIKLAMNDPDYGVQNGPKIKELIGDIQALVQQTIHTERLDRDED